MNNTNEWVGGKQVYGGNQKPPKSNDWLDELSDEDLGFNVNPVGWKPKNRTVENKEETK
jgi:hypothetical protein